MLPSPDARQIGELTAEMDEMARNHGRLPAEMSEYNYIRQQTVRGVKLDDIIKATRQSGYYTAAQAPILIVISEKPYVRTAAVGAKLKGNDYRSIDIGIVAAYLTAEASAQGLSTCILGWLDDAKIRDICGLDDPVRLVITLGYAKEGDKLRPKKRKTMEELVTYK